MKRKSSKLQKLERNRYSIFTNDLNICYYCHRTGELDIHEVYGGSNRIRSIKNGLCVPLCRRCHSSNIIITILRKKLQIEYEKTHSREEFIKLIGKSYL